MSNDIQVFNFNQNEVRIHLDDNNNPWWIASDICSILDLVDVSQTVDRLDEDEKADTYIVQTSSNGVSQRRKVTTVNEMGLYSLILTSRKPEAKQFKRWITHEVLPSIRKTGSYSNHPQPAFDPSTITKTQLAQIIIESETERLALEASNVKLQAQHEKDKPAVDFALNVIKEHPGASSLIGDWAKSFDCGIGRNNAFKWLRDNNYLTSSNLPYQEYIERGYFTVKQTPVAYKDSDGINRERYQFTTLITTKGMAYFSKKLREAGFTKHQQTSITVVDGAA